MKFSAGIMLLQQVAETRRAMKVSVGIRLSAVAAAAVVAGCGTGDPDAQVSEAAPAADQRPNILLIVVDDMGYTDLGSFGGEIPTPNLDELAYGGVRLANFHAAPACAPARAMLLSGMDNHEAGIGSMNIKRFFDNGTEPDQTETGYGLPGYEGYLSHRVAALPEVLRDAGYRTYMAGKWDLGRALVDETNPAGRGFESSFVQTTGTTLHLRPADGGAHGGISRADPLVFRENWDVVTALPEDHFSTEAYTDKIIEYIDANRGDDRPFFAYLALTAPHWPLQVPEDWLDRFAGHYGDGYDAVRDRRVQRALELGILPPDADMADFRRSSTPWPELDEAARADQARRMEIYAAMVANIDHHVGRLAGYLRDTGEFDNTFIVFTSDNGASGSAPAGFAEGYDNSLANMGHRDSFIEYGLGWAEAATAPYRDVKGSIAEGGVLAAAFVAHATLSNTGGISREYLTMQDVMPTLLQLAGAEAPTGEYNHRPVLPIRGKSFLDHLQGGDSPVHGTDEAIGWELHGERALVRWPWKLLWLPAPDEETRWELFDLDNDPFERHDLSAQQPELIRELIDAWYRYAEDVGVAIND